MLPVAVTCPVVIRLPPVMLPVVDIVLAPNAAMSAVTLALPYELAIPVSCDPLPRK